MRPLLLASFIFAGVATAFADALQTPDNAAAISLYRQKKNADARAAFETLVATDPKNAEAFHFLGLIALREKRDDDAVRFHESATQLAPENIRYLIALADAYGRKAASASLFSKLTWAEKCHAVLQKAVALEPSSFPAQSALVEYYRRAPGIAGGGLDKAFAQAEVFRKIEPLGGTQLLVELYRREKKFSGIFPLLDTALASHPDNFALLLALGRTVAESGQNQDRGLAALQRALALPASSITAANRASAWFYLGEIHAKRNDVVAAKSAYEHALQLAPGHPAATAALTRLETAPAK